MNLRSNHAIHYHVCYCYVFVAIWNQFWDTNFSFWVPTFRSLCICVSRDVRIRGYFLKPKGVREQNSLGNTDICCTGTNLYLPLASALCVLVVCCPFVPETYQKSDIAYLISIYLFFWRSLYVVLKGNIEQMWYLLVLWFVLSVNYSTWTLISSALSVGLISNEHLYWVKKTGFGIKKMTRPNSLIQDFLQASLYVFEVRLNGFSEKWTSSTEKPRWILTGALFLATVHGKCFYVRLSECRCVLTDRVLSVG